MQRTGHLPPFLGLLLAVSILSFGRPVGGDAPKGPGASAIRQIAWRLTDARVVSPGQPMAVHQGTVITGYRIQATATSIGEGPYRRGSFDLSATLFAPKLEDRDGEKREPELWYLNATWLISDPYVIDRAAGSRYSVGGRLQGTLDFNPATQPGLLQAPVVLTVSSADSQPLGQGTFSGNERFEGMLSWGVIEPARLSLNTEMAIRTRAIPASGGSRKGP
jgi:hypothetical protein